MDEVDQRGFDDPSTAPAWLDGAAACALLGVRRETLYAYASRGLVRREPVPGRRAMRYLREDLERLRARSAARAGHGPVAAGALSFGEPVLASAITAIDDRGPRYRGVSAIDLAHRGASLEDAAALLWSAPVAPAAPARLPGALRRAMEVGGAPGSPLDVLASAHPVLARADGARLGGSRNADLERAGRLLPTLASLVAGGATESLSSAARERGVARILLAAHGVEATPGRVRAADAALVLVADHELNASAFAARVVASTGADLFACLSAALAALSGPLHGGACDRVEALLDEVAGATRRGASDVELVDGASAVLAARARRGDAAPGFGHPLYPLGDPRCPPLLAAAAALEPRRARVRSALALEVAMGPRRLRPTVDLGLVAVAAALGLPRGAATAIFALGRAVGWVAHVLEQREQPGLLRPRARYVGRPPAAS